MGTTVLKFMLTCFVVFFTTSASIAQSSLINLEGSRTGISATFNHAEDTLKKQFDIKRLAFPPRQMYVRSFKYERELEVWVRYNDSSAFQLFKTYKICMESGTMGPKRMQGDYQVPEGFYYINQFNPNSNYHLALGLNYPNTSDKIISDSLHLSPGSEIYIHGDCVSTGCIPISDEPIEELYLLASFVKTQGQDYIPVHVFPVRYNVKKSFEYLAMTTKDNQALQHFAITLKEAFDYFEATKQLPVILTDKKGQYVINN
jgi:murein L,D-transpeptidase YafK